MALLLDAGEFGIALVDDHVEKGITHLLRRDLAEVLPLAIASEVSELNLFGLDRTVERVEMEAGDLVAVDADFFAPLVEEALPLTEGSDFCDFAWHTKTSQPRRARRNTKGGL